MSIHFSRLCFSEVLLNKIAPNLREIHTAWRDRDFFLILIYEGEIYKEDLLLARQIGSEAQSEFSGYNFHIYLHRVGFPHRLKVEIYEKIIPDYDHDMKQICVFYRWENDVRGFVED